MAGAARAIYATHIWGVALASFVAAISGTIDSGGVRRLRLNTLSFRSGGAMLGWHLEREGGEVCIIHLQLCFIHLF